jgi:L-lactate dehydrogenase (cytochrome)
LFAKTEIMIDGGIRTGADVVKALALGAKAVGVGRPILYANGTHGEDGVKRVLESESTPPRAYHEWSGGDAHDDVLVFREEITNTMRNCGVSRVEDLRPEMVGPAGPWVGWNRPVYVPPPPTP